MYLKLLVEWKKEINYFIMMNSKIQKLRREILPSDLHIAGKHRKLLGTHTYSQSNDFKVIDVEYLVFNKEKWKNRIQTVS